MRTSVSRRGSRRRSLLSIASTWRSRRGVAIILVLGVMALLLVLAMSMAMSSIHSSKNAGHNTNLVQARQYAELGLQRVVGMLKTELIDTSDYDTYFPGSSIMVEGSGAWEGRYYLVSMSTGPGDPTRDTDGLVTAITHEVNSLTYIPTSAPTGRTRDGSTFSLENYYSWRPIYANRQIGDQLVQVLTGRYAYIVIDETGKVDPNSTVDTDYAEGTEIASSYVSGKFLSEMNLQDLGFSSSFAGDLRPSPYGKQPAGAKWYSRYHIIRELGLSGASGQTVLDKMNKTLFPYRRPDVLNDQRAIAEDVSYEVTYNLYDIPASGDDDKDVLEDDIVNPDNTGGDKHPGIPWFRNWVDAGDYAEAGDRFATGADRGLNLAANLKDYWDTNYNATRDQAGLNNTGTDAPTYFGNERVPYLARFQIAVRNETEYDAGDDEVRASARLSIRPELINMFGDFATEHADDGQLDLKMEVTYQFWTEDGSLASYTDTEEFEWSPMNIDSPDSSDPDENWSGDFSENGYIQLLPTTVSGRVQHGRDERARVNSSQKQKVNGTSLSVARRLHNVKVRLINARFRSTDGSEYWDYARPTKNLGGQTDWSDVATTLDYEDEVYWTYTSKCPMNNLFPPDWERAGPSNTDLMSATSLPEYWTDPETRIFIRNGPMQHLVELGVLWRMEPPSDSDTLAAFRTLNLIDYNYRGDNTIPGDYSDSEDGYMDNWDNVHYDSEGNGGDRNILDMVRLGNGDADERTMIGRVNVNSRQSDVLKALFRRVTATRYTYNEAISTAKQDAVVANILAKTLPGTNAGGDKVSGPLPIGLFENNRNAPLYGLLFQPEDLPGLTEDEREHLLMQTIMLINGKHNYFTVVVAAQTLQDVGGIDEEATIDGVPSLYGRYDQGADKILSEQKIRVILYRNAVTNNVTVERFDYLDE